MKNEKNFVRNIWPRFLERNHLEKTRTDLLKLVGLVEVLKVQYGAEEVAV